MRLRLQLEPSLKEVTTAAEMNSSQLKFALILNLCGLSRMQSQVKIDQEAVSTSEQFQMT